jgi:hypothetical protein
MRQRRIVRGSRFGDSADEADGRSRKSSARAHWSPLTALSSFASLPRLGFELCRPDLLSRAQGPFFGGANGRYGVKEWVQPADRCSQLEQAMLG